MSTPTHPYQQHERELLVGAFLDIYLDTFKDKLTEFQCDAELNAAIPEDKQPALADYIGSLTTGVAVPECIALMSDESLYLFVKVFGKDPFDEETT